MNKPIISFALIAFAGAAAVAAGCSSPDPGVEYLGPRHLDGIGGNSATNSSNNGTSSGGGTTSEDAGGGGVVNDGDGGAGATGEGGAGASDGGEAGISGAIGPFKGLTAYASKPVAVSARTNHANNTQAAQTPTTDCLSCHVTGGAGVPFLAAGWVATAANGTTGAADVEVGAYATGTGGTAFSAHTDADGFFWINPPNGGTTGPYCGGVRQTTEVDMPATQTVSDCNSSTCHGGTGTGPIHYP